MSCPPDREPVGSPSWHSQSVDSLLVDVGSTPAGLDSLEVARRLEANGRNELNEGPPVRAFPILLSQFDGLIVWILITAGVISGMLGESIDAAAILTIVGLNAVVGFYQEYHAEQSIAALKQMTAPQAKARRDGLLAAIPSAGIVVGDVLEVEAGDLVAADARLLEAASLKCVESALTGESEAVTKQAGTLPAGDVPLGGRSNMLFMGTTVATGTGVAVVVNTAMETELGRIAGLLNRASADEDTPLQHKLNAFGRILVWGSLCVVALMFGLGLLRGTPLIELLMTSISLAVAAVPEGLPAVVTVALALGVLRMSRRKALVRKLAAVETLGSTSVICTDKTGTLTVGEMTVRALYVSGHRFAVTGEGYDPDGEILLGGVRADQIYTDELLALGTNLVGCNNAHLVLEGNTWKVIGDPTEGAMLAAGAKTGADLVQLVQEQPRQSEIPFDSDRKCSTVIRRLPDGQLRAYTNGAPDVLLQKCTHVYATAGVRLLTADDRQQIGAQNAAMAQDALRVLGSAYRDLGLGSPPDFRPDSIERDLVFVGLTGMYDPPRAEAKDAVAECHAAGIRVVMITGDHPRTALAIARELGIATNDDSALSGVELDQLTDAQLAARIVEFPVYARVTAAHKLRIVRAWKATDAVVAMTGDGVNDAPAIKGADIGIAMGKSGTEVTKQASDMIITDDNFASIVAAVEEGRGIYNNIRKTLQYLLAGNSAELLLMLVCVLVGLPVPLLPIHLLWINLVTDGLPALCLATDPADPEVMRRRPRQRAEQLTDRSFVVTMVVTGALTAAVSFAVYLHALQTATEEMARTQAFAVLVFAELLRAFGCRSETRPIWRISLKTNVYLAGVVAITFSLQVWSHHNPLLSGLLKTSPLDLAECFSLLAIGSIPLVVLEAIKLVRITRSAGGTAFSHRAGM